MKKFTAVLFSILLCALISMSAIGPVQAQYIRDYKWIGACYEDWDPFYPAYVVAYKTGSTANLIVDVYSAATLANVSAVKVGFDWGVNYTSTECSEASPVQIPPYQSRVFTISFTVPSTTNASNLVVHWYTIYVEFVNSTTGPKQIIYTDKEYGYDFAVYSADQADARELYTELYTRLDWAPYFSSDEAQMLVSEAEIELYLGYNVYHMRGDFATAKTHYQNGLNLLDSAFTTESDYVASWDEYELGYEEAQMNYYIAMANATSKEADAAVIEANATMKEAEAAMKQADAVLNQSYAWILFGLGFVFMGLATIIYAYKKPKAA